LVWYPREFLQERKVTMKAIKYLEEDEIVRRGVSALYKELGPMEARRFLTIQRPLQREDGVQRHRKWQASLNKDEFFKQVMKAHKEQSGKKV
jgi:hypothetical protein